MLPNEMCLLSFLTMLSLLIEIQIVVTSRNMGHILDHRIDLQEKST